MKTPLKAQQPSLANQIQLDLSHNTYDFGISEVLR
jgi:hypothetical protein